MALETKNISTSLVGTTLGTSSRDVGTLCTHPNVNPYSKHKPVAFPNLVSTGEWWKAVYTGVETSQAGDCGLRVQDVVRSSSPSLSAIQDATSNRWEYRKPNGGSNEPFRLGDFRMYDHQAVPPIQTNIFERMDINVDSKNYLNVYFSTDPGDSTYNLQAYDLKGGDIDLRNYRFYGILVDSSSNAIVRTAESEEILDFWGELQTDAITFNGLSTLSKRLHKLYIVLRNMSYTSGYEFIPLPQAFVGLQYNIFPIDIYLISNPVDAGGGISDPYTEIAFIPVVGMNNTYIRLANQASEDYGGTQTMRNQTGEFNIRLKLSNSTNYARTINKGEFKISLQSFQLQVTPETIYGIDANGLPSGILNSVTVPANGSVIIWLNHGNILLGKTSPEIDIKIDHTVIFNGVLNYANGTSGWT